MTSIIKAMEGAAVGVGPAADNLKRGLREGHTLCIAESGFELSAGSTTYAYYTGKFLNLLPLIASVFTDHIPQIISMIGNLISLQDALGVLGILTNTARAVKESISLYRQRQFISLFEKHAWKGPNIQNALAQTIEHFDKPGFQEALPLKFRNIITGKKHLLERLLTKIDGGDQVALEKAERIFARWTGRNIRDKLVTITNLPGVELERALPEWLYRDIVNQGGKIYLSNLLRRVDKSDLKAIAEATKLLDTMQSYAAKKQIVHVLKIIGAVIGLISCIGFFVACPWAVTGMFLVLIGIFAGGAYLYNSGYVENREDRFSLKLCFPEFIRNIAFAISNSPETFKAWMNAKKPKVLTPHPFFERRIEMAQHKSPRQIQKSYSAERLERRTRLAAQGILLSTPAAA
ncbi:MAG TPA: hypothetical protein VIJ14_07400 [Rhabdochlamydiaceae bacterium]